MKKQNSLEANTKKKGGETMKKVLLMTAAIALFAVPSMAAISTTKHNLSTSGSGTVKAGDASQTQICVFCHTPHNATQNVPLWNRTNPAGAITTYAANNSPSINNTIPTNLAATSISRFCLSCHDGNTISTRVVNNPNGATYTMGGGDVVGTSANIGTDLSNDHPVGFQVVDGSDPKIKTLATMKTAGLRFFTATADYLECATCHDVHDAGVIPKFLRINNDGSALCLTCHDK